MQRFSRTATRLVGSYSSSSRLINGVASTSNLPKVVVRPTCLCQLVVVSAWR
jgi:hypothetical protein